MSVFNARRRSVNRRHQAVALGLVGALALAACGGGGGGGGGGDDAEGNGSGAAGAEITVSYMQSGTYDAAAKELEPEFEAETGAEVTVLAKPFETLIQSYITDLATQTGQYDVISVSSWIADVYDQLLPLDEYFQEGNYAEGFIPEVLEAGKGSEFYNGKRVGVPYAIDAYGVLYRKDLFDAAKVDPEWSTWEELLAALDELEPTLPKGVSPLSFAYGAVEQTPAIWMSAYGGYLIDKDGKYAVDDDAAVAALELEQRTLDYAPSNAMALSIDEANAAFLRGDAAVLVGWPSFVRAAADDPAKSDVADKWAMAEMPGPGFPWLSAWNLGISKQAEDPDAAWKWIEAYINETNATAYMEEYGIGSPFTATYDDPTALEEHGHDYPNHLKNLQAVKNPPWNFEAFEIAYRSLGEMLTGNLTPEETVRQWESRWADVEVPEALLQAAEEQGLVED